MNQTALLLGDPHLGKNLAQGKAGLGSQLNSRIADQLQLLNWVLEQALEQEADDIIVTGDIFEDPKPHPSLIALFVSWLKKCQAHYIHVHLILGNHDLLRSGFIFTSSLDIIAEMDLENVSVYKNINTFFLGTTAITIVPFRDRKSFGVSKNEEAVDLIRQALLYEMAYIPPTYKKVVIGHLAIQGSIPVGDEIDDLTNELFCPLDLFQGYDYVWMGHVHKPQVMQKSNPYIAHLGSMDISNFGETDQKKHIIVMKCDTPQIEYTTHYLPIRPLRKISLTIPKEIEDTTGYVLQTLEQDTSDYDHAIVRVEIVLSTPELKSVDKDQIEVYLMTRGVFNVLGISESKKTTLIKKETTDTIFDSKMDIPSAIKAYASKCIDTSMREDYIELAMEIYRDYKEEMKG
jgi:DNA repair protein SbcD/Mre11